VDCQCLGTACNAGETQNCFNECHQGQQVCNGGEWSTCDAAQKLDFEQCDDGIDNDCNGKTDENPPCVACTPGQQRTCEGVCGEGDQTCDGGGNWGPCDAPTDCTCESGDTTTKACGNCGTAQGNCGPDGVFIFSDICTGEGPCAPNEIGQEECGNCGMQTRTCGSTCAWGEWSECANQGQCKKGEEAEQACGNCGSQTRLCDQKCAWGVWSECVDGTGCVQGETKTQSCGNCGTQTSTCLAGCQWSDFGACDGAGPCVGGEVDEEACGNCGNKKRTCANNCTWGQWTSCLGAGPCAVGESQEEACGETNVGICEYGTKVHTCNGNCQWNPFGSCLGEVKPKTEICGSDQDENCDGIKDTQADQYETNNTCNSYHLLNSESSPDVDETVFGTFHTSTDKWDYYGFYVDDGTSVLGPEHIKVDLTQQQGDIDADLFLYKGTDKCNSNDPEKSHTGANQDKKIDWSENFASNDGGLWIVGVQNYGGTACYDTYSLKIVGLD